MKSLVDVDTQSNGPRRGARFATLLATCLMFCLLGVAPGRAQGGMADELPTATPEELAAVRTTMDIVFDGFEDLGTQCGITAVLPRVSEGRLALMARSDEELLPLVRIRPQLEQLAQRISDLHSTVEAAGGCTGVAIAIDAGSSATSPSGKTPSTKGGSVVKTLPDRYYEDFPRAEYSTVCGNPPLDGDAWFVARLIWEAAKLATDLAHDACEWLIVVLGGANAALACIPVDIAYAAADIVFTMYEFCIDDAAGARASAVLSDTEHLHTDIEQMQEDVDFIKDAVTCRPVLPLRRGSGCNGNDDDCNPTPPPRTVDECDEDIFGPLVYIPASVGVPWYPTVTAARVAVEQAVVAMDDCQSVVIDKAVITGACDSWAASVTATDACGNATTAILQIKIDPTPPMVIIPPSLGGTCFSSAATAEAAILAQTNIQDDCATLSEMNIRVDSQVEGCSLHVRIEATNPAGQRAVDSVTVRVDTNPPEVRLDASISNPWYRSVGEALAAIIEGTHVTDDCQELTLGIPQLTGTCGNITARVTATDACGNTGIAQTLLRVDGTSPTVTISASVAGRCFTTVDAAEAYVRSQTIIVDDCLSVADLEVHVSSSVSECGLRVSVEAVDLAGNRGADSTTVRVDVTPPTVLIDRLALGSPTSPLGFQATRCFASTAAAEASVLAATHASDGCTAGAAITKTVSSSGTPCSLLVTAKATDSCGQFATDSVRLRVDVTPPTLTCAVSNNRLTPSDKRMVDVGFGFVTNDGCDAASVTTVVTVTSDEQTWGGGTSPAPDAEILRDPAGVFRGVRLRAECNSPGDGRVYKITVRATDACGNASSCTSTVNVPNSTSQNIDSGQNYDAVAIN